jgi:hypothetical protein
MTESALSLLLLAVIAACSVVLTATWLFMARDVQDALRETRQAMRQARRLLARGDNATRHVESVVIRACEAAAGAVAQFGEVRKAARRLFNGNGRHDARSGPRVHHRRAV